MGRLIATEVSLQVIVELRPLVGFLARRDPSLVEQIKRAANSVVQNLEEGARRVGRDRLHLWRVAEGSAAEVKSAVDSAVAWGYIPSVPERLARLQRRQLALLYGLTHMREPPEQPQTPIDET